MITSITTKSAAVALITKTLTTGWALGAAGTRWDARLTAVPVRVPVALWRLCARVTAVGEVLVGFAERIAPRLGVDMNADVLEPLLDRA